MKILPEAASSFAGPIDGLFAAVLWICIGFGVLVQVLLLFALVRYRRQKKSVVRPLHSHGNPLAELVWTAVPLMVLVWLALASQSLWAKVRSSVAPPGAAQVEVLAQQFAWNVRYPGNDGVFGRTRAELRSDENPFGRDESDPTGTDDVVTINEMSLKVDQPVRLVLGSRDVIHSFFVPEFRFKQDALPGSEIEVWFVPTKAGTYEIACAEFCGMAHYRMKGFLTVGTAAEHEAWLAERK